MKKKYFQTSHLDESLNTTSARRSQSFGNGRGAATRRVPSNSNSGAMPRFVGEASPSPVANRRVTGAAREVTNGYEAAEEGSTSPPFSVRYQTSEGRISSSPSQTRQRPDSSPPQKGLSVYDRNPYDHVLAQYQQASPRRVSPPKAKSLSADMFPSLSGVKPALSINSNASLHSATALGPFAGVLAKYAVESQQFGTSSSEGGTRATAAPPSLDMRNTSAGSGEPDSPMGRVFQQQRERELRHRLGYASEPRHSESPTRLAGKEQRGGDSHADSGHHGMYHTGSIRPTLSSASHNAVNIQNMTAIGAPFNEPARHIYPYPFARNDDDKDTRAEKAKAELDKHFYGSQNHYVYINSGVAVDSDASDRAPILTPGRKRSATSQPGTSPYFAKKPSDGEEQAAQAMKEAEQRRQQEASAERNRQQFLEPLLVALKRSVVTQLALDAPRMFDHVQRQYLLDERQRKSEHSVGRQRALGGGDSTSPTRQISPPRGTMSLNSVADLMYTPSPCEVILRATFSVPRSAINECMQMASRAMLAQQRLSNSHSGLSEPVAAFDPDEAIRLNTRLAPMLERVHAVSTEALLASTLKGSQSPDRRGVQPHHFSPDANARRYQQQATGGLVAAASVVDTLSRMSRTCVNPMNISAQRRVRSQLQAMGASYTKALDVAATGDEDITQRKEFVCWASAEIIEDVQTQHGADCTTPPLFSTFVVLDGSHSSPEPLWVEVQQGEPDDSVRRSPNRHRGGSSPSRRPSPRRMEAAARFQKRKAMAEQQLISANRKDEDDGASSPFNQSLGAKQVVSRTNSLGTPSFSQTPAQMSPKLTPADHQVMSQITALDTPIDLNPYQQTGIFNDKRTPPQGGAAGGTSSPMSRGAAHSQQQANDSAAVSEVVRKPVSITDPKSPSGILLSQAEMLLKQLRHHYFEPLAMATQFSEQQREGSVVVDGLPPPEPPKLPPEVVLKALNDCNVLVMKAAAVLHNFSSEAGATVFAIRGETERIKNKVEALTGLHLVPDAAAAKRNAAPSGLVEDEDEDAVLTRLINESLTRAGGGGAGGAGGGIQNLADGERERIISEMAHRQQALQNQSMSAIEKELAAAERRLARLEAEDDETQRVIEHATRDVEEEVRQEVEYLMWELEQDRRERMVDASTGGGRSSETHTLFGEVIRTTVGEYVDMTRELGFAMVPLEDLNTEQSDAAAHAQAIQTLTDANKALQQQLRSLEEEHLDYAEFVALERRAEQHHFTQSVMALEAEFAEYREWKQSKAAAKASSTETQTDKSVRATPQSSMRRLERVLSARPSSTATGGTASPITPASPMTPNATQTEASFDDAVAAMTLKLEKQFSEREAACVREMEALRGQLKDALQLAAERGQLLAAQPVVVAENKPIVLTEDCRVQCDVASETRATMYQIQTFAHCGTQVEPPSSEPMKERRKAVAAVTTSPAATQTIVLLSDLESIVTNVEAECVLKRPAFLSQPSVTASSPAAADAMPPYVPVSTQPLAATSSAGITPMMPNLEVTSPPNESAPTTLLGEASDATAQPKLTAAQTAIMAATAWRWRKSFDGRPQQQQGRGTPSHLDVHTTFGGTSYRSESALTGRETPGGRSFHTALSPSDTPNTNDALDFDIPDRHHGAGGFGMHELQLDGGHQAPPSPNATTAAGSPNFAGNGTEAYHHPSHPSEDDCVTISELDDEDRASFQVMRAPSMATTANSAIEASQPQLNASSAKGKGFFGGAFAAAQSAVSRIQGVLKAEEEAVAKGEAAGFYGVASNETLKAKQPAPTFPNPSVVAPTPPLAQASSQAPLQNNSSGGFAPSSSSAMPRQPHVVSPRRLQDPHTHSASTNVSIHLQPGATPVGGSLPVGNPSGMGPRGQPAPAHDRDGRQSAAPSSAGSRVSTPLQSPSYHQLNSPPSHAGPGGLRGGLRMPPGMSSSSASANDSFAASSAHQQQHQPHHATFGGMPRRPSQGPGGSSQLPQQQQGPMVNQQHFHQPFSASPASAHGAPEPTNATTQLHLDSNVFGARGGGTTPRGGAGISGQQPQRQPHAVGGAANSQQPRFNANSSATFPTGGSAPLHQPPAAMRGGVAAGSAESYRRLYVGGMQ